MGILSSLYTGVAGLQAQGEALSIYGDNIANANTVGFKTSRPEFQDIVAKSIKGVLGGNQIGTGAKLAAVNPVFSQGSIQTTESATDLSITGDGFFVAEGLDGRGFTRNGSFHFDKEGALINSDGNRIMGFKADEKGRITSRLDAIKVDRPVVDAKPSSEVEMYMNLDTRADKIQKYDPERPEQTAHFGTGVTVYDSNGQADSITVFFNKSDDGKWTWRAMSKGEETVGGTPGKLMEQARGKLLFDTDGKLKKQVTEKNAFNFAKGAAPDQKIDFNFGIDKEHGGDGLQVTQYGTASESYKTIQDGATAGTMAGMAFSDDGILSAVYSNGQSMILSQVALARFENPEQLLKAGQNRFKESRNSGQPTIGAPRTGGRGSVASKSLENSTTDIASEFINLMTAQRNFQANTRVVKVADEMMQDVINMKRG